jgi:hypothetical protein
MGWIVSSHQGLAGLVASSAKFRTITGAASESAALDYVHFPYPLDADTRPWALIDSGEGTDFDEEIRLSASGSLAVTIEVPESYYSAATDDKELWLAFAQDVDTIYEQMVANSNKAKGDGTNYWNLTATSPMQMPYIVRPESGDPSEPYLTCSFLCRWV